MGLVIKLPAGEKLVEYFLSGVADPMLAVWRAKRFAKAREIEAESHADTAAMLQSYGIFPYELDASFEYDITIGQDIEQRLKLQENKRQRNIGSVVYKASELLSDVGDVPDQEPDHDWTARFFNEVQDVSSEEMQVLWAKVLAGEVEKPGSTSLRTLDILRKINKDTAKLFERLCSVSCSIIAKPSNIVDCRAISFGKHPGENPLKEFGLSFANLNALNEHGLVIPEYNSWIAYNFCIAEDYRVDAPFRFQSSFWGLKPLEGFEPVDEFRMKGVALSIAGKELSQAVGIHAVPEYDTALRAYFESLNLEMVEVAGYNPW
ncbi:DUF2806 domain-containing protein [Candidatus Poriferisocius sp.]|uniref:DUF2806 domain-containing protein n=1 Tax=Candidatus Poriferisocius sp. TaxID=3101276 RepID=UPI003B59AC2F